MKVHTGLGQAYRLSREGACPVTVLGRQTPRRQAFLPRLAACLSVELSPSANRRVVTNKTSRLPHRHPVTGASFLTPPHNWIPFGDCGQRLCLRYRKRERGRSLRRTPQVAVCHNTGPSDIDDAGAKRLQHRHSHTDDRAIHVRIHIITYLINT